ATLDPVVRAVILGAEGIDAVAAYRGRYALDALVREAAPQWDRMDALMVPSVPSAPTIDEVAADPNGVNAALGTYTNFVNLLDLCALAVPGPFRGDGRPAGVTLIAPAGRDGLLAAIGERLHAAAAVPLGATGRPLPPLPVRPAGPAPDRIEVAVVGAHLSGMPLNRELVDRGASFVRRARTQPCYRLHALAGSPRPGLVRVPEGGAAIETEIWALPPTGFAALVATIPPPLGLGTLLLDDGTTVKGYLCEAEGARGAEDISRFGGWRAYVAASG
ncbi:MAG: amidase family protein, partial [Alphaproteobacteria bacterium]